MSPTARRATATGDLNSTDVDNPNDAWTAVGTTPTANGYGSYTLTAAGLWTYTLDNSNAAVQALNAGETLTDTFTAVTTDGTQQLVTITINGRNDAAVISGAANGSVTEAGGVDNGTPGTPPATGDLNSTDVDNPNDLWVPVNTPLRSQFGTYTLTAAGVWTYTLDDDNPAVQARNVGQTLTDTFAAFTVGGTQQLVTITINGANDAADVTGPVTGTVVEAGELNNSNPGTPTATGDLSSSDLDNPNDAWTAVGTTTERQWLRQLYAHRRRAVDLHAGQQQRRRAGAQCRADADRHVHRHDGWRHPAAGDHHHHRQERRCSDQWRFHRAGGRGRRCQ